MINYGVLILLHGRRPQKKSFLPIANYFFTKNVNFNMLKKPVLGVFGLRRSRLSIIPTYKLMDYPKRC